MNKKLHDNKVILHLLGLKYPSALDWAGPGLARLLGEESDETLFAFWREEARGDELSPEFILDGKLPSLWRLELKDYCSSLVVAADVVNFHLVNELGDIYDVDLFGFTDEFLQSHIIADWQDFAGWTVGLNLTKCCQYLQNISKTEIVDALMPRRSAIFHEEIANGHIKTRDYFVHFEEWQKRIGLKSLERRPNVSHIENSEMNMICVMLIAVVISKFGYDPFGQRDDGAITQISESVKELQTNYYGKIKGTDRKTINKYLDIAAKRIQLSPAPD